jgi:hypothetical protein
MSFYNTDEFIKRFIVIEGIDGARHDNANCNLLTDNLGAPGYSCVTTEEPTKKPIGLMNPRHPVCEMQAAPNQPCPSFRCG